MNRRRPLESDSLDMLLDAISNTFGGVLFLAVLVAILLRFAGEAKRPREETSQSNSIATKSAVADRLAELESLKLAIMEQHTTLDKLDAKKSNEMFQQVRRLKQKVDELTHRRADLVALLAGLDHEIANKSNARDGVRSELGDARRVEAILIQQLQDELKKRSRTARLPALRTTSKREFPLVMQAGRVYFPYAPDATTIVGDLQLDEFRILTAQDNRKGGYVILSQNNRKIRAVPNHSAGIAIGGKKRAADRLRTLLRQLDKRRAYVAVAVWEDSFAEFVHLKNVIVDLGLEYRIVPIAKDDFIGSGSSEGAKVQ